jgi:hypothetical protein
VLPDLFNLSIPSYKSMDYAKISKSFYCKCLRI